ncbi:MAG TPA: transposase [Acidimicrobiales bacterium]|nr:transposase [Acidimicrobiales bacterium]
MAFTYSTPFREAACLRMLAGESVDVLSKELKVSAATLHRWKKQALIDANRKPGLKSFEPDELARARRRIKDLEKELEMVKAASALFDGKEVVRPKGSAQSSTD